MHGWGVPTGLLYCTLVRLSYKANWRIESYSCLYLCRRLHRICKLEAASGPTAGFIIITISSTTVRPQIPLVARTASSSIVVTEGTPPVSFKAVERIQRWEYVKLANLLISQDDALSMVENDQKTPSRSQQKPLPINDIQ